MFSPGWCRSDCHDPSAPPTRPSNARSSRTKSVSPGDGVAESGSPLICTRRKPQWLSVRTRSSLLPCWSVRAAVTRTATPQGSAKRVVLAVGGGSRRAPQGRDGAVLRCGRLDGARGVDGSGGAAGAAGAVLRADEGDRRVARRVGGEVHRRCGDGGVRSAGRARGRRAAGVRAAVEMREALPELGVEGRIGVNTGEVVTGTEERLATGDAVNVAARLEQAAQPGEVLIGAETLRARRGCGRGRAGRAARAEGEDRAGGRVPAARGRARRRSGAHDDAVRRP